MPKKQKNNDLYLEVIGEIYEQGLRAHKDLLKSKTNLVREIFDSISPKPRLGPEDFSSIYDLPTGTVVSAEQLKNMMEHPDIIMIDGSFFDFKDSKYENAFTKKALKMLKEGTDEQKARLQGVKLALEMKKQGAIGELAQLEQKALTAAYRHFGMNVSVMAGASDLRDAIFSTDSDKSFRKVTEIGPAKYRLEEIISLTPQFTNKPRQREAEMKKRYLETSHRNPDKRFHRKIEEMENRMEFGDTRVVFHKTDDGKNGGFILAGICEDKDGIMGRSTEEGHEEFRQRLKAHLGTELEVHTIGLNQPFYHMDTTGIIGTNGDFFTNRMAYTDEGWKKLNELFGDRIKEVSQEDLMLFLGNGTCFNNKIFTSDMISKEAQKMMTDSGYDVIMTPINSTYMGGGGHRCMTSVSPELFISGGYEYDKKLFDRKGEVYKVVASIESGTIELQKEISGKFGTEKDITGLAQQEFTKLEDHEKQTKRVLQRRQKKSESDQVMSK